MNEIPTRVWWVRHLAVGQSGVYLGRTDLEAVVPDMAPPAILPMDALWFCSPLKRAVMTAQWLGKVDITLADELQEQHFGAWEGRRYEDVWNEAEHDHDWSSPELLLPPEGERFVNVCARVDHWLNGLYRDHAGEDIVIVVHAGVIRAAMCHALNLSPSQALALQIDYASVTHISQYSDNAAIHYINRLM